MSHEWKNSFHDKHPDEEPKQGQNVGKTIISNWKIDYVSKMYTSLYEPHSQENVCASTTQQ